MVSKNKKHKVLEKMETNKNKNREDGVLGSGF